MNGNLFDPLSVGRGVTAWRRRAIARFAPAGSAAEASPVAKEKADMNAASHIPKTILAGAARASLRSVAVVLLLALALSRVALPAAAGGCGACDDDGDGLTNEQEVSFGTNPYSADTDHDGLTDPVEIKEGTNPNLGDTDQDGVDDDLEIYYGSDPLTPDDNYSPLPDLGVQQLIDSDGDGLWDVDEQNTYGTNPYEWDTDGDGLSDRQEITETATDPNLYDTDGDGMGDGSDDHPLVPYGEPLGSTTQG